MKLAGISRLVYLILCVITTLLLQKTSSRLNHLGFLSSPVLFFIAFNSIILFILVQTYRPSNDEYDGSLPSFIPSIYKVEDDLFEEEQEYDTDDSSSSIDEDDDGDYDLLDGYEEDNDDDNSSSDDDDFIWKDEDEEEEDHTWERRIEEFIAKVNKGWREEMLKENFHNRVWLN